MKVLVALQKFAHIGGTETYVLTVAEQLQRLGHQVGIYAQHLGDMAMLARDRGGRRGRRPRRARRAADVR